ncbi:hypothetical protein [Anabaena sp. CCY 0017]|uniref:hypothetical protein n=1 Tax=Anabaena sp. CCY 0017 TaxID=3103866 RepID=UPI0039C684D8
MTTVTNIPTTAILEPAQKEDMPVSGEWKFAWQKFWDEIDFENQGIVKITYDGILSGLIRFAVYSNENGVPYLLEVLHLECLPQNKRLIEPLGRWLLWYVVQIGLTLSTVSKDDPLILLDSVEDAIEYYRDVVQMEPLGWTTLAPGEDGYAFQFTLNCAKAFCQTQTNCYGYPTKIKS